MSYTWDWIALLQELFCVDEELWSASRWNAAYTTSGGGLVYVSRTARPVTETQKTSLCILVSQPFSILKELQNVSVN